MHISNLPSAHTWSIIFDWSCLHSNSSDESDLTLVFLRWCELWCDRVVVFPAWLQCATNCHQSALARGSCRVYSWAGSHSYHCTDFSTCLCEWMRRRSCIWLASVCECKIRWISARTLLSSPVVIVEIFSLKVCILFQITVIWSIDRL
jgi:hypothetical protein